MGVLCIDKTGFLRPNHIIIIYICDQASVKGPSGYIKCDHVFQLCCIITKDIIEELA